MCEIINSVIKISSEHTDVAMPEALIGYVIDSGSSYYFAKKMDP